MTDPSELSFELECKSIRIIAQRILPHVGNKGVRCYEAKILVLTSTCTLLSAARCLRCRMGSSLAKPDPSIAQGLYCDLYPLQEYCSPIRLQNAHYNILTSGENSRLRYS